jgi:glycosyltransferase involved in cell wall biosynthesis
VTRDGSKDVGLGSVLVVNTANLGGGAERSAMAIVDGFERLGTRTWMAVGDKRDDDPRVVPLYASEHIDYRPYARRRTRTALAVARHVDRAIGLEDFRHPYSHRLLELVGERPNLVLLGNLHGGYFDLRALPALCREVPVVMRLADSWAFTGHCALPNGCARWETGCGSCPDLATPPAVRRDATRVNWLRKRRIFAGSTLGIVAPSQWILDRARRSLIGQRDDAAVIRTGVDLDAFSPGSRSVARAQLGLERDGVVLLAVANGGLRNPFKDFDTLLAALSLDGPAEASGGSLRLVVVGGDAPEHRLSDAVTITHRAFCPSPAELAVYYRAADLFVHSALEDPSPRVVAEAQACGVAVVASSEGGASETIADGETGLLVRPADPAALADAIAALIADPPRRGRMGRAARARACASCDLDRQVGELHAWCSGFVARRAAEIMAAPAREDELTAR